MKRVFWAKSAQKDMDRIWRGIATDSGSIDAATRVVRKIEENARNLGLAPLAGTKRESFGKGLRGIAIGHYMVYYRVNDRGVLLLRVVHGRQDQDSALLG